MNRSIMGPGRLHALTDGVFAIAMTLLVLDLPRPQGSSNLAHDLAVDWPSCAAYLVSFVTVGLLWIEHTGMMSAVRKVNRRLLERTLLFLLFISIIPWPTALAAQYAESGSQASTAAVLYAGTMLLMGLSFWTGWRYLAGHPELVSEPARAAFPAGARRALAGARSTCSRSRSCRSARTPPSRSTPWWRSTLRSPGARCPG